MPEATATFDPELECVREARRFCQETLARWRLDACEPAISAVVTELATNSVLHARTEFSVTVAFDGEVLRVGVSDGSVRMPVAKSHSIRAMSGRGLHLVAATADVWGVEPHPGGKTVWASLRPLVVLTALDDPGAVGADPRTAGPIDVSPVARCGQGGPSTPGARWAA